MTYPNDDWQRKSATLSNETARKEFGLTKHEIYDAIDAGARCPALARMVRLGASLSCRVRRSDDGRTILSRDAP
jgi:hypothetical protein